MGGNWVAPLLDTGTCKLTIGLSVVAVYSRGNVTVHFQENAFSFCRRLYRRSNRDVCVVAWQHETQTTRMLCCVRPTDQCVVLWIRYLRNAIRVFVTRLKFHQTLLLNLTVLYV